MFIRNEKAIATKNRGAFLSLRHYGQHSLRHFCLENIMTLHNASLVFGATLLLSLSSIAAHAQFCNNSVLSGGYSYQLFGQAGTEAPFPPFVSERLVTLDGNGGLSGNGYRVVAGAAAQSPVTGTYSVQPNCSVNFNISSLREDGSVIHQDQFFAVITEAGLKVQGVLINSTAPGTFTLQFEKVFGGKAPGFKPG